MLDNILSKKYILITGHRRENFGHGFQEICHAVVRLSKEFKNIVRDFCVESIKKTFPYSHGDWHPDNILEHNGQWTLVDWDWGGKRSLLETQQIINQRLKAIFGYEVDIVQKRELLFMEKL